MLDDRFGLTHTTLQVEHVQDSRAVELGEAVARSTPVERG
jgi:hypothetical protein